MLPDTNVQLTPEQIAQIEQARRLIPLLKAQIRKAISAGIDVQSQQTELDNLAAQLDKLYRVYVTQSRTPTGT